MLTEYLKSREATKLKGKWNEDIRGIHEFLAMAQFVQGDLNKKYKYNGFADFILKEGRPYNAGKLPRDIPRGEAQQCFMNSYKLMESYGYTYVEGYAVCERAIFPIVHAWTLDFSGNVIDNTWVKYRPLGYYGVAFRTEYVQKAAIRSGYYGILENIRLMHRSTLYPLMMRGTGWKCREEACLGSR